jgi:hypothetical protein
MAYRGFVKSWDPGTQTGVIETTSAASSGWCYDFRSSACDQSVKDSLNSGVPPVGSAFTVQFDVNNAPDPPQAVDVTR